MTSRTASISIAIVLGLGAAGSASCSGGRMTPKQKAIDEQLAEAGDHAWPGGQRVRKFTGRAARGELEDGFIVMLSADQCYAVVTAAEPNVRTISMTVTSPTGAWLDRTREVEARPALRVCTKVAGPHRIAVKLTGHGDFAVGVYGKAAPPKANASASAKSSASAIAPVASAAPPAHCDDRGQDTPFHRRVDGADRACHVDDDCITIKLDCGMNECSAVGRTARGRYGRPLDCRGYDGPVATEDCDPQLGLARPRCVAGCCTSERVAR